VLVVGAGARRGAAHQHRRRTELLEAAYAKGRVQILGNDYFAGVQCDGKWILVEGRARITQATREWQTLRAMKHQLAE
jgi:hypothetical protein